MFPSFLVKVEPGLVSQFSYFFSMCVLLCFAHIKKIILIFSVLVCSFFSFKAFSMLMPPPDTADCTLGTALCKAKREAERRRVISNHCGTTCVTNQLRRQGGFGGVYSQNNFSNYQMPVFFNYFMNYNYPSFNSYGACLYCNQWPSYQPPMLPLIRGIR